MMKCLRSLFLGLCVATAATSAIAQDGSTTASEFTAADATLSYLSGAAVGTVAGLGTAYAIRLCRPRRINMCVGDAAVGILGGFTLSLSPPHWASTGMVNTQTTGRYWSACGVRRRVLVHSFHCKGRGHLVGHAALRRGRVGLQRIHT